MILVSRRRVAAILQSVEYVPDDEPDTKRRLDTCANEYSIDCPAKNREKAVPKQVDALASLTGGTDAELVDDRWIDVNPTVVVRQ